MDLEIEQGGPETEEEDGNEVLGINVSVSELDNTWHSVSTMIPADQLTPDRIAEAMISCMLSLAAQRGSSQVIALQQRLMSWGETT